MGDRNARQSGNRDRRADTGNHLHRHPGQCALDGLLAAAAEQEVVAALQPHHAASLPGLFDEDRVDVFLRRLRAPRDLADVDLLGVRAGLVEHGERRQPVVDDDIGLLHGPKPPDGDEVRVTWAAAHQNDSAGTELVHDPPCSRPLSRPRR